MSPLEICFVIAGLVTFLILHASPTMASGHKSRYLIDLLRSVVMNVFRIRDFINLSSLLFRCNPGFFSFSWSILILDIKTSFAKKKKKKKLGISGYAQAQK